MRVVNTFNFTGGLQGWVVPAGVTSVFVECWGAAGGASEQNGTTPDTDAYGTSTQIKAPGGYISGYLSPTPGDPYYIYVGGMGGPGGIGSGAAGGGGYNGGGAGGTGYLIPSSLYGADGGSGGGGATDIRYGGGGTAQRIIVAGGGGGQGGGAPMSTSYIGGTTQNPTTPQPPYGGGSKGSDGVLIPVTYYPTGDRLGGSGGPDIAAGGGSGWSDWFAGTKVATMGGGGANQTAGGAAGYGAGPSGTAGSSGQGGAGAGVNSGNAGTMWDAGGGGGGGGYYGGGGGGAGNVGAGAGGGGSNWADTGKFTSIETWPHVWPPANGGASGAGGMCRLTYTAPPLAPTINSPANGKDVDPSLPLSVTFTHNGGTLSSIYMTAYDIAIQDVTASGSYVQTHVAIPNNGQWVHTYAASTFTAGHNYNLRVRTYDAQGDVSDWTTISLVVDTPLPAPTVTTSPTGTVTTTSLTTNWTNPSGSGETQFHVRWIDAVSSVIYAETSDIPSNGRTNLAPNPSFSVDTNSWVPMNIGGAGADPTITRSSTYSPTPGGGFSGLIAWAATGYKNYMGFQVGGLTVGQTYVAYASVAPAAYTTDPTVYIGVGDLGVRPVSGSRVGSQPWTANGTFQVIQTTFVADAPSMDVAIGTNGVANGSVYVGKVMVEKVPAGGVGNLGPWFDGDHLNGNSGSVSWYGTAGASASLLTVSDTLTYAINTDDYPGMPHNVPMKAQVRYQNSGTPNVWSAWGTSPSFTLDIDSPGAATVTVTPDNATGSASLAIAFVMGSGNTASVYADIYRRDITNNGEEIRIAKGVLPDGSGNATYVDKTLGSGVEYRYRVRVVSFGGGYTDTGDTT